MNRIVEIKTQIADLQNEMRVIQRKCVHPKSCQKLESTSEKCRMNYDNQEYELEAIISHWHCTLCDKHWETSERQC
jgi:hypothetical protein